MDHPGRQPTRVRHGVMAYLCALAFILYIDRICIGQAGTAMKAELDLSNFQWGLVGVAFQVAYAVFEPTTGHWGDRYGSRRVLIRIVLWWSAQRWRKRPGKRPPPGPTESCSGPARPSWPCPPARCRCDRCKGRRPARRGTPSRRSGHASAAGREGSWCRLRGQAGQPLLFSHQSSGKRAGSATHSCHRLGRCDRPAQRSTPGAF